MEVFPKNFLYGFRFARAEQAVINENAGQLVTDRPVNESCSDRGINAAGKTEYNFVFANLSANFAASLFDKRTHRPVGRTATGPVDKVFQNVFAQRCVRDLRVKLQS